MRTLKFKLVIFSLFLAVYATAAREAPPQKSTDKFTADEIELVDLTNKKRISKGLSPLKMNKILTDVARDQSADMARHHHLSHTVKGKSFTLRIKGSGYPVARAGENVARAKSPFPNVIKMWMKSPGHRKNILNPHFKEIGVGITPTPHGDRYFTQIFGTPKTSSPQGKSKGLSKHHQKHKHRI